MPAPDFSFIETYHPHVEKAPKVTQLTARTSGRDRGGRPDRSFDDERFLLGKPARVV